MAQGFDPGGFDPGAFEAAAAPGGAFATPALVQSAAVSSATITLPSAVAAGNALFVAISGYAENADPSPTGISSSPANAWTKAAEGAVANLPDFGARGRVSIWCALDAAPGATSVTVAFPASGNGRVAVAEFSGVAAAAALDEAASSGGYSAGSQEVSIGPTAATDAPNQLVLAVAGAVTALGGNGAVDYATPAGFARIAQHGDGFATAFEFCWRVASAAGQPQTASFGTAPAGNGVSAAMATFRPMAAPPAQRRRLMIVS